MSSLGRLITVHRREQGLTLVSLASRIGYRNVAKGARRIAVLEQRGVAHPDLIRSVIESLSIDKDRVESARREDRAERNRAFLVAAGRQVDPRIRLRLIPGFYVGVQVPDGASDADIEALAKWYALRHKCEAHVVLRSGIAVSVSVAGEVVVLRERLDDGVPQEPRLSMGSRSIASSFVVDPEE